MSWLGLLVVGLRGRGVDGVRVIAGFVRRQLAAVKNKIGADVNKNRAGFYRGNHHLARAVLEPGGVHDHVDPAFGALRDLASE